MSGPVMMLPSSLLRFTHTTIMPSSARCLRSRSTTLPHVANAAAVHEHPPGGDGTVDLAGLAGELEDGADLADVNVPGIHAHGLRQLGVELQMPLLAVDGDEELGFTSPWTIFSSS